MKGFSSLVCGLVFVVACSSSPAPDEIAHSESAATVRPGRPSWGLVLGGITHSSSVNPWNATDRAEAIACDITQLGSAWVRVDAGYGTGDLTGIKRFIPQAHARGLKVLVLVHPGNFDTPAVNVTAPAQDVTTWTSSYVKRLGALIDHELTGAARADAYEIGNEPNGGQSNINAGAFAVLEDRVWREVRGTRSNPPLIVAGGPLGVWIGQPWWQSYFYHLDLLRKAGRARPWDVFAIHPYHSDTYRVQGAEAWSTVTKKNIGELQTKLTQMYGSPSKLWVTELGWDSSRTLSNGQPVESWAPAAASEAEQADLFGRADDTFAGLVDVAFWYVYRDDEPEPGTEHSKKGVRKSSMGAYAPKLLYASMASRLGGNGDAAACWDPTSAATGRLIFDAMDARRTTSTGDWRPFAYKAECGSKQAVTGLSVATSTGAAHAARCGPDNAVRFPHATCVARVFEAGDARGTVSTGDWDFGFYKGECAKDEYVAGISQTTTKKLTSILCCRGAVQHAACAALDLQGKDSREAGTSGDWDVGYWKGECGPGRYVAGASRSVSDGKPHRLLCCAP